MELPSAEEDRGEIMKRVVAAALCCAVVGGCAAGQTSASEDASVLTFEEYKALTPVHAASGSFVLGDMLVSGDVALREFYDEYVREVTGIAKTRSALTINQVNGVDDRWSEADKRNLTYCVSTAFPGGPRGLTHDAVVSAMAEATLSWAGFADVSFRHVPGADSSCSGSTSEGDRHVRA
jgi:hypothetical protein